MQDRIGKIIDEYREKRIYGKCIELVPLSPADIPKVVEIRNREKNRYFLNQTFELTIDAQEKWYSGYLERDNDLYWCIYNKQNQFIGTIRIYDIDDANDMCNQGSFMIDEEQADGAPYALEAEILSLDFIFDILKIGNVINEDRADNKVMNNLTRKIGFGFKKKTIINGVEYNYYLLNPDDYKHSRNKFSEIIDYLAAR
jgi:RimJ/RimL family protein N-acetyltransferase